jgi:trigger factor
MDREIQMGDYVLADVKGEYVKPKEGDEDKSAGLSRTGFATFIREQDRDDEWPYKGFNKELIGMKAGETKNIKHKYPKDDSDETMRGETVKFEVTVKTVRGVTLPDLDDDFAKKTGAGDTVEALKETLKNEVENRSRAEYDDKYFGDLVEIIKEGATIKYAQQTLDHEGEHVLEDLQQRLSQQGLDLPTYFKMRNTTQEQFIIEEVQPVAKKRMERSLILDELIRKEKIQVDNTSLDSEFNSTLNELQMQGLNLSQIRGGRQGQQRIAEAVAMESASRLLTRRALDTLKAIATGEYKPPETEEADTPDGVTSEPEKESPEQLAAENTVSTEVEEKPEEKTG